MCLKVDALVWEMKDGKILSVKIDETLFTRHNLNIGGPERKIVDYSTVGKPALEKAKKIIIEDFSNNKWIDYDFLTNKLMKKMKKYTLKTIEAIRIISLRELEEDGYVFEKRRKPSDKRRYQIRVSRNER
jgi:hypothetical protein